MVYIIPSECNTVQECDDGEVSLEDLLTEWLGPPDLSNPYELGDFTEVTDTELL